jgi:hypothetical protein
MKNRLMVSRRAAAFVIGAAALIATGAMAGGVPKERSFTNKVEAKGILLQTSLIGKYGDSVDVYQEDGTVGDNIDGPRKLHCLLVVPFLQNTNLEGHGFCIETDQDGDQIISRTISGTRPNSADRHGVGEVIMGTGKYAGMMSSSATSCKFSGSPDKYSAYCDVQGSYTVP